MRARLAAAALFAALFTTAPSARADDPAWVIAPGNEPFFLAVLSDDPGGCRCDGISVERDHVTARYHCGADTAALELHPPDARAAAARTSKFTLVAQGDAPASLTGTVRDRLLAREAAFTWTRTAIGAHHAPPDTPAQRALRALGVHWDGGLNAAIALALGMIAAGLALIFAGKKRLSTPSADEARAPLSSLAKLLAVAFVAVAVAVVARFRFIEDDFFHLLRALDRPWEMDDSLRLVSGALLYGAGVRLGPAWFIAVNLAVWIGSAAMLFALFRRAGHARDEALVAASLAGLAPGYFPLVRSGIGFQTSASIALHYVILLLVDEAARTRLDERARRAGLLLVALGLTSIGVFIKYPMMAVVPIFAWLWGKLLVRDAPPPLSRTAFYAAFAAAIGLPLALVHTASGRSGELDKAGLSALVANVATAWLRLAPMLGGVVFGAAVLYLGATLRGGPGRLQRMRAALRDDVRAFADRRPYLLASLAAVALAPFLFNARYFAPYYVVPCLAWIAAIVAVPLAAAARRVDAQGRAAVLVSLVAAAQIVPIADTLHVFDAAIANDPTPLLAAARRATAGLAAPCGLRLEASCATPEATAASANDLRRLCDVTEDKQGLRWATGWHEVDVALAGDDRRGAIPASCAAPLTLRYCAGRGMWVTP